MAGNCFLLENILPCSLAYRVAFYNSQIPTGKFDKQNVLLFSGNIKKMIHQQANQFILLASFALSQVFAVVMMSEKNIRDVSELAYESEM